MRDVEEAGKVSILQCSSSTYDNLIYCVLKSPTTTNYMSTSP